MHVITIQIVATGRYARITHVIRAKEKMKLAKIQKIVAKMIYIHSDKALLDYPV